ncbi:MAG: imidazolonepropionase [Mariniblastus sp.]|jgi:imidazolonepropionase
MNPSANADVVLTNFMIATMTKAKDAGDALMECVFSGKSIAASVQHVDYGLLENVSLGIKDGVIAWMALTDEIPDLKRYPQIRDGAGQWLTPGLIDCHTHLVYGGNRADEWEMRLTGQSYEAIARSGGGILSSVRATRAASQDELLESAARRLTRLMAEGVTTIEIKSGYGLDLGTELKMLEVAHQLGRSFPVQVQPTLLGAHAVPPEFKGRADAYVDLVCHQMIPAAKDLCTSVDVFCESIAFDLAQTKRVFEAAQEAGLNFKAHAEQLSASGASEMAAEMGALSVDHLEYLTPEACQVLGQHETVATLLPGAFYCLQEKQKPPVESLRENGVPIAIATDSNPGSSPVLSLLLMGNMACNLFGMTPAESLAGMTRNAAKALGMDATVGTIEVGKRADLAVWNVGSPAEIVYGIGSNPCQAVCYQGEFVEVQNER